MSEEMKQEIIKAHIYGVSDEQIAEVNGASLEEVKTVLRDTAAIEEKKQFLLESGWLQA